MPCPAGPETASGTIRLPDRTGGVTGRGTRRRLRPV